jgi:hypothetical protein
MLMVADADGVAGLGGPQRGGGADPAGAAGHHAHPTHRQAAAWLARLGS